MASSIGIKQADGMIIPLVVSETGAPLKLSISPAHAGQKKFRLSFFSLPSQKHKRPRALGRVTLSRHDLEFRENAAPVILQRSGGRLVIAQYDLQRGLVPLKSFSVKGKSAAGMAFKILAGVLYLGAIGALVYWLLAQIIPGFDFTYIYRLFFKS